jgi:hypothetical protein
MATDSKNSYGLNNTNNAPAHLNGRIVAHPIQAMKGSPVEQALIGKDGQLQVVQAKKPPGEETM